MEQKTLTSFLDKISNLGIDLEETLDYGPCHSYSAKIVGEKYINPFYKLGISFGLSLGLGRLNLENLQVNKPIKGFTSACVGTWPIELQLRDYRRSERYATPISFVYRLKSEDQESNTDISSLSTTIDAAHPLFGIYNLSIVQKAVRSWKPTNPHKVYEKAERIGFTDEGAEIIETNQYPLYERLEKVTINFKRHQIKNEGLIKGYNPPESLIDPVYGIDYLTGLATIT